jgi:Peptidase family M1 domain
MLKNIFIVVTLAFVTAATHAQDLYMPRNVKEAYENQTRSKDGRPGKNYFQNRAVYDLEINAMPPDRTITGIAKITYFNNSPDTLTYLVIRTIQNIHKKGAIRSGDVSNEYLTDGILIDEILVNKESKKLIEQTPGTWKVLELTNPLNPNVSVNISMKWHYEISKESAREGMIDSTTFFMGYAYPSICVYDDYYGWDVTEFNDLQEFYYDFNDYKVTVNVPKNFIVWGTGNLINPAEVLQETYANRLKNASISDKIISIVSSEELKNKNTTSQNQINSWKFEASNIPDVAYAISDHYVWDASSVIVDSKSNRRTSVQTAYNDTAKDFHNMAQWTNYSIKWFSENLPGVAYPYPKITIFQGYADMEFPMLVNGNNSGDSIWTRRISAEHEVAHSWFPFYMGINESRYAFMDEGWASFFESIIAYSYLNKDSAMAIDMSNCSDWSYNPYDELDLPIITPSTMLNGESYQLNSYVKPCMAYTALKDLLGDKLFKKCLLEYMDRWNGKHPIPWDFFNTFNELSGKNLNYFWKSWFFENNFIDFSVEGIEKNKKGFYNISIKNVGGAIAPIDAIITYMDNTIEKIHQTPESWTNNQEKLILTIKADKKIKCVLLETGIFVDADESNNFFENR